MLRISIKTKLGLVIGLLVLSFIAFNVVYYPRRVESQIRSQSEVSARQVAETASYALAPALTTGNKEGIANLLEGVKNIPAFMFSAVFDANGQPVDSTHNPPAWVHEYAKDQHNSKTFNRASEHLMVAVAPIFYHDGTGRSGVLILGFSTEDTQAMVQENIRLSLIVGLSTLVIGILLAKLYGGKIELAALRG